MTGFIKKELNIWLPGIKTNIDLMEIDTYKVEIYL